MFLSDPVPFEEAARAIEKLAVVDADTFRALLPELQGMAFTISGLESLDAVKAVRDEIAALPRGESFDSVRDKVAPRLTWLNPVAAERRATLLVRMHGFRAAAAAAHRQLEAHKDVFPSRQYLATMDGNTRPHHAALHGKVLPADHPFWVNHTGPWEYNCRCEAVALTPEDVAAIREQDDGRKGLPPEDRRVVEGAFLTMLETEGKLPKPNGTGFFDVRTPRERNGGEGFEWRAGDVGLPAAEIEKRYDAKDWAAWKKKASQITIADGRSVWEWFTGVKPPAGKSRKPAVKKPAAAPAAVALLRGEWYRVPEAVIFPE